ncbi:alpha/beta hydrolase [Brevibacillus centrosporus]|uniref:alpha/beta fold hydrolase n=1 Tax=Brevibacillus centrosporus TaxID=54910 RepID=UPI002E1BFFB4|nr:alpha/beta hydrolase [Brevibacillus centrosporus]
MSSVSSKPSHIEIRQAKVEYVRKGSGQPLLVLHGAKDLMGWQPYHEMLSAHFDVIVPSHPGFGRSELLSDCESIEDLAYFYLDFVKALRLENLLLVGCDIGGWIAAEMAVRNTSAIAKLTLVGSVGIKVSDPLQRDILDLNVLPHEEQMTHLWYDPAAGQTIMTNPYQMADEELTVYLRNQETETMFTWKPFMYNPQLKKRLHRIDVPTAVIWGEADQVVSASYGEVFADEIPDARLILIEKAGHLPHLEQPSRFVEELTGFAGSMAEANKSQMQA